MILFYSSVLSIAVEITTFRCKMEPPKKVISAIAMNPLTQEALTNIYWYKARIEGVACMQAISDQQFCQTQLGGRL